MARQTAARATRSVGATDLGLAIQRLRARMKAESPSSSGWSLPQLSVLHRIIQRGPITASELAKSEYVRPQSVADTIAGLKAAGFVAASPDPTDGRKTLLSATAEGRATVDEVIAARGAWLQRAVDVAVSADEVDDLARTVDLLNRLADCDTGASERDGWRA